MLEMTENAGKRALEEALALFFNKLASPLGLVLQDRHDIGEEAKMAGIVLCMGVRGVFVAGGTQRLVVPHPKGPEHGSVLAQ